MKKEMDAAEKHMRKSIKGFQLEVFKIILFDTFKRKINNRKKHLFLLYTPNVHIITSKKYGIWFTLHTYFTNPAFRLDISMRHVKLKVFRRNPFKKI